MLNTLMKSHLSLNPKSFHKIAYRTFGHAKNNRSTVICVHGLTRNSGDFEFLAEQLASDHYVICPDIVGRGQSDWLHDPKLYTTEQYLTDLIALIAHLNVETVDWIGTSMGGLLGMLLASKENTPIRRFVLNDIGPSSSTGSLLKIKDHIDLYPTFSNMTQAELFLQQNMGFIGHLSTEEWQKITSYSVKKNQDNTYHLAYDPAIAKAFMLYLDKTQHYEQQLWQHWSNIHCPMLLLRGMKSDVLDDSTVAKMQAIKPHLKVIEFEDVGHAPALRAKHQTDVIKDFLA